MMHLIEVENVNKTYRPRRGPSMLLARGGFVNLFRRRRPEEVRALEDVSFTVDEGEAVGIIGANGSGKSTLLKLLAGVTVPTTGRVAVRGRVASLLELGAGFHPLLTGRENVYLNAGILGMPRHEIDAVFDAIVAFSGIEEFIDNPVNTYSSGMFVRLGFAVAAHTNPDIFLVDEVLSVGDEEFQRKCRQRIGELRAQGKTIVFVSHDLGTVNSLCNRVVLLSKGRMMARGTPQATIEYYLRQIGRQVGIHTFSSGQTEAVFCHGRVSLFHRQREVTAPTGLRMNVLCMGQYHPSASADWVVEERGPDGCRARGRMSRLPVTLIWDLRLENDLLRWGIALECEQDTTTPLINTDVLLPAAYTRWTYGESLGDFPDIVPGDQNWTTVVLADWNCRDTAALPGPGSDLPPVLARLEAHSPYLCLLWSNSDYVTGARALQALAQFPDSDQTLKAGRHELMTLHLDLGQTEATARERAEALKAERTIQIGPLAAQFERGAVSFTYDGEGLTHTVHLHTQALIAHMWNMSHDLKWASVERSGDRLEVSGESSRLPCRQHWQIEAAKGGIAFRVWIEAKELLEVQEYNVSLGIKPQYAGWETSHESGAFPPFDPTVKEWRHLNRSYAPGAFVRARGPALPSIALETANDDLPFRMTVINTGFEQHTHVLQAIYAPEQGQWLHFEPGRHLWFDGFVKIAPNTGPDSAGGPARE